MTLLLGINGVFTTPLFLAIAQSTTAIAPASTTAPNLLTNVVQAIILGLVQGITEFLPISSTAHLLIFTKALGWTLVGEKSFVDAIQFGSVIAVLMYFWSDIHQLLTGSWKAFRQKDWELEEWKILVGIAVGTLPALMGGLVIKTVLSEDMQQAIEAASVIAVVSIIMALLLGLAEQLGSRKRTFASLSIKDGILVGLGQMLALVPGASRSGSTITTALFLGLQRQTAARFSFLLGLPTLTIATLYQFKETLNQSNLFLPLLVGIISTFIFSYLSIAWLLRYLQRQSTWIFVWYRLVFGLVILGAIMARN
jgi:undecaprenyl-diphosphatase